MIRADLRRLKERETFLRNGFLEMRLPTRGDDAVATVKIIKKRRFRRDLLPQSVLDDASLWETEVVRHVHVDNARNVPAHLPGFMVEPGDAEVIEPF